MYAGRTWGGQVCRAHIYLKAKYKGTPVKARRKKSKCFAP